jgi:tRNA(His) 5'-end guanylyltransferase
MSEKMKNVAVAAVAAGIGFVVGRKMAQSKCPEGFSASVGQEPASEGADGQDAEAPPNESLSTKSEWVKAHIRKHPPTQIPDVDPAIHYVAPHVPKPVWNALGDLVSEREKTSHGSIDGSHWISLRLDGSGFSKTVKLMRNKGILEKQGFSDLFASCMQSSLRALMEHFQGRLGYTQSDEMIVFIPPTNVVRGERQPHQRNGRVTKLTTLAASFVTSHFIMQLAKRCVEHAVGLEDLSHILPHFDCRVAQYTSWEEAQALLMWRAYDCSVNGVSDAVYHTPGSGKQIMGKGREEKVAWLHEQGLLPLPRHQAYGTVLVRVKRIVEGYNPKLGTNVKSLRGVIEQVDGPVLELVRTDTLFPANEEVPREAAVGVDQPVSQ